MENVEREFLPKYIVEELFSSEKVRSRFGKE